MKRVLAAMTAALLTVALVGPASAASAKWTLWAYSATNGYTVPLAQPAANPHGGTIATFAFDSNMDQAKLTSVANGYTKNGSLLGKTVTATISITGTAPSYTFTAYSDPTVGCNSTTAVVRFYFDTKQILGALYQPAIGSQPAIYVDQMWWSSVSISLADLYAAGPNGVTLSVSFAPANWSNLAGTPGNADSNFSIAASNVNQIGFSFGSPDCYAFGDGSTPAGALFNLQKFSTTTP
jgi:curli biogenesis system outer membrane secretion channel CsgG